MHGCVHLFDTRNASPPSPGRKTDGEKNSSIGATGGDPAAARRGVVRLSDKGYQVLMRTLMGCGLWTEEGKGTSATTAGNLQRNLGS
ncbi:hypothetical protein NQZ68_007635 [Dissostichus eleginoides]|nr:hypothetical protein NQZ68_007635 [Dissostichus eleginoides]